MIKQDKRLHGFVYLGDVNNDLQALESELANSSTTPSSSIATHVLTIMVRGIFIKLEFPYANFPTQGNEHVYYMYSIYFIDFCIVYTGVSGNSLYWIVWEAVRRLEEINLKVSIHHPGNIIMYC